VRRRNGTQHAGANCRWSRPAILELSLAAQEIATRSEIRQSLALLDLGHRFGVLAGQPRSKPSAWSSGRRIMLRALRDASNCLDLPAEHRVLFCHAFDRVALSAIGTFYAALNAFLVEHRILRHLRVHAPFGRRAERQSPRSSPANQRRPAQRHGRATVPCHRHGFERAATRRSNDPESVRHAARTAGRQAPRAGAHTAAKAASPGYVPSAEDVQSVLGRLQSKQPAPARRRAARLRSVGNAPAPGTARPVAPVRAAGPTPAAGRGGLRHDDLVGMLFDYIEKSAPANGSTQKMLTQLQVPMLRVALRDKSFFSQGSHPARLLLNAIAETGIHWIDDSEGEADPVLLKKMHLVIERLNAEFDGDLSLIERMLGDLSQHVQTLARKAEVSERRLVDASKGREKLGLARETASNAIAARVAAAKPGRLLRTMLEQAWTDVLALTLSASWRRQRGLPQATGSCRSADCGGRRQGAPTSPRRRVAPGSREGSWQVGFHHDEIQAVVRHLLAPGEVAAG
jgi:hypothetical protein